MNKLFDTDEVHKLLQIPQLVSGVGPGFQHILAEAMARLREINDGLGRATKPQELKPAIAGQPVANPEPTKPVEAPESEIVNEPEPTPKDPNDYPGGISPGREFAPTPEPLLGIAPTDNPESPNGLKRI